MKKIIIKIYITILIMQQNRKTHKIFKKIFQKIFVVNVMNE